MDAIDGTRRVRPGEELDVERLAQHLSKGTDDDLRDLSVEQFPSGNSNLTYLVRAGNREWVLRRPPFGSKVATAHDMGREFRILSKLAPVYPRVPQPVLFGDDETVLGAKFYLMERIRGVILRRDPPRVVNIDEATARRLSVLRRCAC